MDAAAMTASAAEAAASGDYKKALKALEDLRWSYTGADAEDVLNQVAREAEAIAAKTSGRGAKRAGKIAAGARERAAYERRQQERRSAVQASVAQDTNTDAADAGYDVTPVSLGIGLVSAALLLIAVFLPRVESNTFGGVEKNTLIQSGDGWIFILLGVGVAGAVWRAFHSDVRSLAPGVLGAIALGVAIYDGTNKDSLTLCPVNPAASQLGLGCSTASPGVGIYMAGVGGALALIACWQIWQSTRYLLNSGESPSPTAVTGDDGADASEAASAGRPLEDRLRVLQKLRDAGLIDEAEYAERRAALLQEI